ncbi:MAG: isochorismatase family cysteine hydrolase [Dehalococcoidia bacterium]
MVDVQNDYCHPEGVLGHAGLDLTGVTPMRAVITRLRSAAHSAGVPVIFLETIHSDRTDTPAWSRRSPYSESICRDGSWGAEPFEIEPGDDEVITKHRYSGFVDTRLDVALRSLERSTLVVTGTATNVCVESTVRDARMRDYDVIVVEDGVAAPSLAAHEASLENMRRHFGPVVVSTQIEKLWAPTAPSSPTA